MAEWFVKHPNENGEHEITFKGTYEEVEAIKEVYRKTTYDNPYSEDFLSEKMPKVPTELRDCSRELEYIKDMIKENEAEHDRLEERRDDLAEIQEEYERFRKKLKDALYAINSIQLALDPNFLPDGSLPKISNFLQDARDYIVDALDEFDDEEE